MAISALIKALNAVKQVESTAYSQGMPSASRAASPDCRKIHLASKEIGRGAAPRPCHHARRKRQEAQHTARLSKVWSRLRPIHLISIETTNWVKCSLLAALVTPPSSDKATNERNGVRSRFWCISRLLIVCCTIDHFSFWMVLNIIINISGGFDPLHSEMERIKECH